MEEGFKVVCGSASCNRKYSTDHTRTTDEEKVAFLNKFKNSVHTEEDFPRFTESLTTDDRRALTASTVFLNEQYNQISPLVREYCLLNDIDSLDKVPRCVECGNLTGITSTGFSNTCGNMTCMNRNKALIDKRQATALRNHGSFANAYSNKNTIIAKYGVDNVSKLDLVKEKKIQTSLKNYGTEYPWQSKEGKRKQIAVLLKKYSVENVSQIQDVKDKKNKLRITNMELEMLVSLR